MILQRKKNAVITKISDNVMRLTSIDDYVRNVKTIYNPNSKVRKFTPTRKRKLEATFSLLLHSLHYACLGPGVIFQQSQEMASSLPEEVEHNINSKKSKKYRLENGDPLNSAVGTLKTIRNKDPSFEVKVNQLLSLYKYGQTRYSSNMYVSDGKLLANVHISLASLISSISHDSCGYFFQDVLKWISSVMAQNVTDSCYSLTGLKTFPNFIIKDILLRNPRSEYEFDLMFEFYQLYCKATHCIPEQVVTNLIQASNRFKFSKLKNILEMAIDRIPCANDIILNRLICAISNVGEAKNTRDHYLSILASQRLIVDFILQKKGSISPLGYLGIAQGLLPLSPERSNRVLGFAKCQGELTPEENKLANIVRLRLSESPELLIQNFDKTVLDDTNSKDSAIWEELFHNLKKFELLNEENSARFMKKFNHGYLPKAATELSPFRTLDDIFQNGTPMNNKSLCAILKKLYESKENQFEVFGAGYHFARHIFNNIVSPDRSIVGTVLFHESFRDPVGAYDLYNKLLSDHCEDIPNEKCLLSLILPGYLNPTLRWQNRFASQIAVHEFRKHCKKSLDDVDGTFVPSNSLWKPYLKLLGRFNYQDELADVLKTWEDLKIVPERETLAIYLAALPGGIGDAKRKHAVKYLVSNEPQELSETPTWDWPDEHEIEIQRAYIHKRLRYS